MTAVDIFTGAFDLIFPVTDFKHSTQVKYSVLGVVCGGMVCEGAECGWGGWVKNSMLGQQIDTGDSRVWGLVCVGMVCEGAECGWDGWVKCSMLGQSVDTGHSRVWGVGWGMVYKGAEYGWGGRVSVSTPEQPGLLMHTLHSPPCQYGLHLGQQTTGLMVSRHCVTKAKVYCVTR